MEKRTIAMALACAGLCGCYIQGGAGYYTTTHSDGTIPAAQIGDTGGAGIGWNVTVGVEAAFSGDKLLVGVGYGGAAVPSGDLVNGAAGVDLDANYRLKKLGKTGGLHVGGSARIGTSNTATATPDGGAEVEAKGGAALDLFGGVSMVNRGKSGRTTVSVGLGIISRSNDELGAIKAIGPEARLRYTWLPSFAPKMAGGGSGGGGGRIRTVQSGNSWVVVGDIGGSARSDARNMLMRGARNMGCTNVSVMDSQKFSATCLGSIVVGGVGGRGRADKVVLGCPLAKGKASCKVIFLLMVKGASR